jgi:homoserine O-acetyltransferase/O-succinyltransferase
VHRLGHEGIGTDTMAASQGSDISLPRIGSIINFDGPFQLESGATLPHLEIAYETYGTLNPDGTNAILVCHALTGSAHAGSGESGVGDEGWWEGIIGKGKGLDTDRYFVICSNILGSCYGTTGPASTDPATGRAFRLSFPQVHVRDMVRAQKTLLKTLGVNQLATVIGGSLGGMQALEWAVLYPDFVRTVIPIGTPAKHSAWCIGISEAQRLAIMKDPHWQSGNYEEQPKEGLALARMIAMISYRSRQSFEVKFGRDRIPERNPRKSLAIFAESPLTFQIESYLRYQGQKLVERFDANTYLILTRAMDLHDLSAGRGLMPDVLGSITAKALCVGISSDVLYPPIEQQELSDAIPRGQYVEIESVHGHDAFLIEFDAMNEIIRSFLR